MHGPKISATFEQGSLVAGLADATPTADRKAPIFDLRSVSAVVKETPTVTIPGLDLAAISNEYHDYGSKPVWHEGTFTAPIDATWGRYEAIRDEALKRFLGAFGKRGWEPVISNNYRPRVSPGIYPARDLRDGIALLDRREFIIGCWFVQPTAKPVRIELPPHLVQPIAVNR